MAGGGSYTGASRFIPGTNIPNPKQIEGGFENLELLQQFRQGLVQIPVFQENRLTPQEYLPPPAAPAVNLFKSARSIATGPQTGQSPSGAAGGK